MSAAEPIMTNAPTLLKVLQGDVCSPPPIWLMRQAGRSLPEYRELRAKAESFLDLCFSPELAAEATLQPIRRFGFDAAILFSDILVIPHALGQKVAFKAGEGPVLEPVGGDWHERLEREGAVERLDPVFETVRRVREALPKETALIGFCGAPWTVATYMVAGHATPDQAPARLMAYRERESFAALIELLADVSADYLAAQIEAGAQAVKIFDSWAGVLPEDEFRAWCVEPVRRMVAALKARYPHVPVIGFPRMAGTRYATFQAQTGVDALACDTSLPLDWIASQLQPHVAVQGNLDPLLLLAGGRDLQVRVEEIVSKLGRGRFVFNLGHGILPETPIAHVEELVRLVRRG